MAFDLLFTALYAFAPYKGVFVRHRFDLGIICKIGLTSISELPVKMLTDQGHGLKTNFPPMSLNYEITSKIKEAASLETASLILELKVLMKFSVIIMQNRKQYVRLLNHSYYLDLQSFHNVQTRPSFY